MVTGKQAGVAKAAEQIQDEFDKAVRQGVAGPMVEPADTQG